MSESETHHQLVRKIIDYVEKIVGDNLKCFIQADNYTGYMTPPKMDNGFRPDVYFEYNDNLIIGEAKTTNDVVREHSLNQYRSYLVTCNNYHGEALFILAVPLLDYAEANNIINKITKEVPGNYTTEIIGKIL